jgi:hypothetical protein
MGHCFDQIGIDWLAPTKSSGDQDLLGKRISIWKREAKVFT